MTELLERPSGGQSPRRAARTARGTRRRRVGNTIVTILGVTLLVAGIGIGAGTLLAPQAVEHAYGSIKVSITDKVQRVQEDVFEELPVIRLGASGGKAELDRCDGTFTEMLSYAESAPEPAIPPVWAAHNNCGGDVLLAWEVGQRLRFDGDDRVYEIVDIRYTPKVWATTKDLVGLRGDLALQSCFYGEDRMKFIGLEPVED